MNEFIEFLLGYVIGLAISVARLFCYDRYKDLGYLFETKKRKAKRAEEEKELAKSLHTFFATQSACMIGIALIEVQVNLRRANAEREHREREQAAWSEYVAAMQRKYTTKKIGV